MVRAAVIPHPEAAPEIREYPDPAPLPGGAVLRTIVSEVCGTDVHLLHGQLDATPYPLIPGHFAVGEVIATTKSTRDYAGRPVREGQIVTFLDVHGTCGACWYCLVAKASTRCPSRKVYGITDGAADGLLGGWSEQIELLPDVRILPLPESVSPDLWIGGGCGLPTALHAVQLADINFGDTVVVLGSGPVGLSATALARLRGAGLVITVGAPQLRLDEAMAMGADRTIDITEVDAAARIELVREWTSGRGADVVIEASGAPAAVGQGMDMARDAGTLIIVGQYTDAGPVEINPHFQINHKHLRIQGCWGVDFEHVYRSLAVLERYGGSFRWDRLITHRYGLDDASEALAAVATGTAVKAVIEPHLESASGSKCTDGSDDAR